MVAAQVSSLFDNKVSVRTGDPADEGSASPLQLLEVGSHPENRRPGIRTSL